MLDLDLYLFCQKSMDGGNVYILPGCTCLLCVDFKVAYIVETEINISVVCDILALH